MALKITPADKAFSLCVKAAAGWSCERCGTYYGQGHRGLHCSHYHGRGQWSVRHDPDNAFAHCYGCHAWFEGHPPEFTAWVIGQLGETRYQWLTERKNDLSRGRRAKREQAEIAAHYRREFKILEHRREMGEMGRMHFTGYF